MPRRCRTGRHCLLNVSARHAIPVARGGAGSVDRGQMICRHRPKSLGVARLPRDALGLSGLACFVVAAKMRRTASPEASRSATLVRLADPAFPPPTEGNHMAGNGKK